MALTNDNVKPVPKTTASWFEFLFDTTGDALKKHLGDASAEPSATQLIVQFLERSGLGSINVNAGSEAPTLVENRIAQHVCHLALRVAAYLQWNLEILEENLSLPLQNVLLGELMKTIPSLQGMLQSDIDVSSLDQKSAMTLIIYYRWVIRTLSQHFLPNVVKSNINGVTAENLANENILRKLQEQLPTAIHILNQALQVLQDMTLPTAPLLLPVPKKEDIKDQEKALSDVVPADDDPAQSMEVDDADKDKVDNKADAKNGSDECNNGSTAGEKMETCTEEVYKVRKDDIIAQVSFDLGTLYFYQEKFQQAMKLFESCKNAQCSESSFYTVNEDKLRGYYMACCGLTGTSPTTSVPPKDTKPSLTMRLEQCRQAGYKDIIPVLLEDNVTFELPLEYRESLVAELKTHTQRMDDEDDAADNIALDWPIMVCNIIREVLEGRPANTGFWLSLENCTQNHLELVFTLCLQSLQVEEDFPAPSIKDSSRFKVLKSFVQLICCNCELVNGWEIARNSAAKIFLDEEEEAMEEAENGSSQTQHDSLSCTPVNAQLNTEAAATGQESIELKRGFLCDKLRHTVDPSEISTIVEQLHQLEKGKRQSQEFVCLLYKSHLEEIKNIQQQDILHILFSKALHCSAIQEYNKASQLLSYALGMVNTVAGRGAVSSPLERVKAAIHQELLVLDICNETNNKRPDEISNRIKSYVWQTATGAAESHIEEQVNAFLLNAKEWEFLSEMRVDENAQTLDHRSLSSLLASTCYLLSKPQGWRKPARILWDGVLKIFSNNMGQQKRPADGGQGIVVTRTTEGLRLTNLIHFVRKIKEETVLTVLISCLVRLRNASNKVDESSSQKEISSSHSHLWPTTITNSGNVNFDHIGLALSAAVHHALSVQHHNISWLQTLADIYMDSGNYSSALQCYLEVGAVSSSFFNLPVPSTVWDDQVYRKMVTCCSAMKAHIQAALLCQCMEVKDYTTAFKALQQASSASSDAMDFYYAFFWDITMLEYLTYTHAKRGQNDKKLLTIQAISQPDLNIFNSSELLQHTEQSRKAKLLRTLAKQYL